MATYEYDIAISFAGEDRSHAEALALACKLREIRIFYDKFEVHNLWGKDLIEYLHEVYSKRARYCVILVSKHYVAPGKGWPRHERKSAQEREFREESEYILPIRLDDTSLPGLPETIGYIRFSEYTVDELADLMLGKLGFPLREAMPVGTKSKTPYLEEARLLEEKGDEWEKIFSAWVKRENDNAINKMESAGFTEGYFKFVIQVPNCLDKIDSTTLLQIAERSECHNTGWPIGVVLTKPEFGPISLADGIKAVIDRDNNFDYWALNNRGHFFFVRSHQEDTTDKELAEGKKVLWFDVTIWRISEIMSYASNLCVELNLKQTDKINLSLSYEGLQGRILKVSSPRRWPFFRDRKCHADNYEKNLDLKVGDILPNLKDNVYQIVTELFGLFDFYKPDKGVVDSIIDEFLNSRL